MNRDPENLKIPAFMRKRSLAGSQKSGKLMLTAWARQEAGKTEAFVEKTSRTINHEVTPYAAPLNAQPTTRNSRGRISRGAYPVVEGVREKTPLLKSTQRTMWDVAIESINKEKHHGPKIPKLRVRQPAPRRKVAQPTMEFRSPLMEDAQHFPASTSQSRAQENFHEIGTLTAFFSKISVAVISLTAPLHVGDTIMYETSRGTHRQTVSSMEVDRVPVFKANPGQEIGLKIEQAGVTGTRVFRSA